MSTHADIAPADLRPLLHAEIDRLPEESLSVLHRLLLEMEARRLADELDEAFDQARKEGRLTHESIDVAIAEHRARHPYR